MGTHYLLYCQDSNDAQRVESHVARCWAAHKSEASRFRVPLSTALSFASTISLFADRLWRQTEPGNGHSTIFCQCLVIALPSVDKTDEASLHGYPVLLALFFCRLLLAHHCRHDNAETRATCCLGAFLGEQRLCPTDRLASIQSDGKRRVCFCFGEFVLTAQAYRSVEKWEGGWMWDSGVKDKSRIGLASMISQQLRLGSGRCDLGCVDAVVAVVVFVSWLKSFVILAVWSFVDTLSTWPRWGKSKGRSCLTRTDRSPSLLPLLCLSSSAPSVAQSLGCGQLDGSRRRSTAKWLAVSVWQCFAWALFDVFRVFCLVSSSLQRSDTHCVA